MKYARCYKLFLPLMAARGNKTNDLLACCSYGGATSAQSENPVGNAHQRCGKCSEKTCACRNFASCHVYRPTNIPSFLVQCLALFLYLRGKPPSSSSLSSPLCGNKKAGDPLGNERSSVEEGELPGEGRMRPGCENGSTRAQWPSARTSLESESASVTR